MEISTEDVEGCCPQEVCRQLQSSSSVTSFDTASEGGGSSGGALGTPRGAGAVAEERGRGGSAGTTDAGGSSFYDTVDLTWPVLVPRDSSGKLPTRSRALSRVRGFCLACLLLASLWSLRRLLLPPEAAGSDDAPPTADVRQDFDPKLPSVGEAPLLPWLGRQLLHLLAPALAALAGIFALTLSMKPPAGQLASCVALGVLLVRRWGAARLGLLGGVAGAMFGAMFGCAAAFSVCQILAPVVAAALSRCCGGSKSAARFGFLAAGAMPAAWLFMELLRLC